MIPTTSWGSAATWRTLTYAVAVHRLGTRVAHVEQDWLATPHGGKAGLVIATTDTDQRIFVIVELKDNHGMSVTNAIEALMAEARRRHGEPAVWCEHYEGRAPWRTDEVKVDEAGVVSWEPMDNELMGRGAP